MKFRFKKIFISCLFLSQIIFAQEITDIIQPIKLRVDRQDTILVSDLFYVENYAVDLQKNKDVNVAYNSKMNNLVLKPLKKNIAATLLDFTFQSKKYSIPVLIADETARKQKHIFSFKPTGKVTNVFVAGSFNNWNKNSERLIENKKNGSYETSLSLDPGSYIYKFVVDGKEIVDPLNPEKSPTGFDDFNSVLRIADTDTSKSVLHIMGKQNSNNSAQFSFYFESSENLKGFGKKNIFALLDNERINEKNISISGNKIDVMLSNNSLSGKKLVRLFVSYNGKNSNIQQIKIENGIPVGNSKTKTWDDGVIYSIMVDRFSDGDTANSKRVIHDSIFVQANYQGGDFKGITKKIIEGYFDSLGINILWLSPVYDNPNIAYKEYPAPHRWYSGYHGYWPISDTLVEEKFGTMAEYKQLISTAHSHNIKVLIDIVAHHVHDEHPSFKKHPEWFGTLNLSDGRKNLRLWDEYRLSTWFEPYMPSYDYTKSKEAIEYVSDNAVWWLKETGADGFRHDAVKHVPNDFWRTLTRKLKEQIEIPNKTTVYQIGETFGDYGLIASYVNNGQLSAQFNFNLSYFAIPVFIEPDKSFASIDFHIKKSFESFGQYNIMGNIMDSHDKVRFMAYADGAIKMQGVDTREIAWTNPPIVHNPKSYDKATLYYAYMLTIPGLPVIYYGSEFGMTGADDPDNRRMMRFDSALTSDEKKTLSEVQQLISIRNNHSALRFGDFNTLIADNSFYAYLRSDMNERILVVLNKEEQTKNISLSLPSFYNIKELVDVQSGTKIAIVNNSVSVEVQAVHYRIFKLQ